MISSVWKFEIPIKDDIDVPMPCGAKILSLQEQRGMLCMWALVDPQGTNECRRFKLFGTGHPIENTDELIYVGTVVTRGGSLVWHLFEAH